MEVQRNHLERPRQSRYLQGVGWRLKVQGKWRGGEHRKCRPCKIISFDLFRNENPSTSPVSSESIEILAWVSPRFVGSLSGLLTNLVQVSPETVLDKVKDEDVLANFVR